MNYLVTNSEAMQAVMRLAEKVALTDSTVLITGESGTGKNVLADFIHAKSRRNSRDLVKIDCAALPKDLLEAELFGYERGAFTGASEARAGRLEAAHKSTLLLDEVALLPLESQAKLLRVLEQREIERLGGRKTVKIDVRVMTTTNVDLKTAVARKHFREDLFFRLNVVQIELPPLRERKKDIAGLAANFLQFFLAKHGRENLRLSDAALKLLKNYEFPGNIRELSNLIERAVLMAKTDEITPADLPVSWQNNTQNSEKWPSLAEIEAQHIHQTLLFAKGNKTKAAQLLGISRKNLYEKLARLEQVKE